MPEITGYVTPPSEARVSPAALSAVPDSGSLKCEKSLFKVSFQNRELLLDVDALSIAFIGNDDTGGQVRHQAKGFLDAWGGVSAC